MPTDLRKVVTPEWVAAGLVGVLLIAVLASGAVASPGIPAASASATPTVRPSASSTMDPVVRNALLTALVVNQRLADRGASLEAVLKDDPSGSAIAAILRIVNTDVLTGQTAADRLMATSATARLGEDLATLYEDILTGNEATQGVSLQETATYVDRAEVLVKRFADLPGARRPDRRRADRPSVRPGRVRRPIVGHPEHPGVGDAGADGDPEAHEDAEADQDAIAESGAIRLATGVFLRYRPGAERHVRLGIGRLAARPGIRRPGGRHA